MVPRRLVLGHVVILAVGLGFASPAPAATRSCSYTNIDDAALGISMLRATKTTCTTAKRVARRVQLTITNARRQPSRVTVSGRQYTCAYKTVLDVGEYQKATCSRASARVRFNITS